MWAGLKRGLLSFSLEAYKKGFEPINWRKIKTDANATAAANEDKIAFAYCSLKFGIKKFRFSLKKQVVNFGLFQVNQPFLKCFYLCAIR